MGYLPSCNLHKWFLCFKNSEICLLTKVQKFDTKWTKFLNFQLYCCNLKQGTVAYFLIFDIDKRKGTIWSTSNVSSSQSMQIYNNKVQLIISQNRVWLTNSQCYAQWKAADFIYREQVSKLLRLRNEENKVITFPPECVRRIPGASQQVWASWKKWVTSSSQMGEYRMREESKESPDTF